MTKATEAAAAEMKRFDLASLDTGKASDLGARIEIVHPITKEPLGMFAVVVGKHGQTFRDIIKERVNTRLKAEAQAQQRGKPLPTKTAEDAEREALELLAACTLSWGTVEKEIAAKSMDDKSKNTEYIEIDKPYWLFEGEELPCSHANALRVYNKLLWIREQIDDGIGNLENFIQA